MKIFVGWSGLASERDPTNKSVTAKTEGRDNPTPDLVLRLFFFDERLELGKLHVDEINHRLMRFSFLILAGQINAN